MFDDQNACFRYSPKKSPLDAVTFSYVCVCGCASETEDIYTKRKMDNIIALK